MPLLAAFLGVLAGKLAEFFAYVVGKKLAFGLAAVAVFTTLTGALFLALRTAVQAVNYSGLPDQFLQGLGMGFPDNGAICLTTIAGTWTACTLYVWQKKALDLFAKTS